MRETRRLPAAIAAVLLAALPLAPAAEESAARGPAGEMMEQTRSLGLSVGNTYVCFDAAEKETYEIDAAVIFDMILKDVGSDLAFAYATAAGYGAAMPRERLDCAALRENWARIRTEFGLARPAEGTGGGEGE